MAPGNFQVVKVNTLARLASGNFFAKGGIMAALFALHLTAARSGDWPQWLGPKRDGHASAAADINRLPADLKPLWKKEIGGGFSSPIVQGEKVVYLDDFQGKETVHVLETADGRELWSRVLDESYADEWGSGPRSTPFADGDRLYVQSCRGEFRCLQFSDGRTLWRVNFEKDFGVPFLGSKANEGTASRRGNNGSGLVDRDQVVIPVGSTNGASLVSFDKRTGIQRWESLSDEAAYSSLIAANVQGQAQIIAFTADALVGVDSDNGKDLWRVPFKTNAKRHAATPVVVGDLVIVNSHTIGLVATRIQKKGERFETKEAWANRALKINLATPVAADGYLFCQGPNKNYICVDAASGKEVWSQPGFGKEFSATIAVGKRLLVLSDAGELFLIAADPKKYSELGRAQVSGRTWSSPAFADGKLFVREGLLNGWKLSCFNLAP